MHVRRPSSFLGCSELNFFEDIFFFLNAVRALSIIGCILVFSSSIVTLVHDIKAVNAFVETGKNGGSNATQSMVDYDYISYVLPLFACLRLLTEAWPFSSGSTVPNQPAGAAFAVINRLLIIFQVIMIVLSEVGWPQVFFDRFFPVLGNEFGLGALGIMQVLYVSSLSTSYLP